MDRFSVGIKGNMFLNKQRYELCFATRYIRVTCINIISVSRLLLSIHIRTVSHCMVLPTYTHTYHIVVVALVRLIVSPPQPQHHQHHQHHQLECMWSHRMLFQKYIQTHICIYIHSPHRCLELKSRNSFSCGGLGLPLQGYVRVILAINTPATCMEHHRGTCQGMDQLKEMRAKLRRLKWTTGGGQELSMGRFGMACLCVHSCLQLYK